MNFSVLIKRLQDIMWQDAGVNGDAQRIEQIVWMLFLKLYDAKEFEWEIIDDNYKSIIPDEYRWRNWAVDKKDGKAITGSELSNFIIQLFNTLKDLDVNENTDVRGKLVKEVFTDLNNYMKDGILIRQAVNVLNEIDLTDFKVRHAFNEIYETILKDLQSAGKYGEFYTPRAITDFISIVIQPKIGDKVADFACGTGGFLISALNVMKKDANNSESNNLLTHSFYGVEKKSLPYLLCTTNMLLHDINEPDIYHDNSLEKNVRDYNEDDKFDVILMNPPFGGTEKKSVQQNFPSELKSSETADLFMIEIMYRLKENGKVGVVLPDGFLNGHGNKAKIREKLLHDFNLHTIVRLPNSVFKPYATVATNILFFDKTSSTKGIWYYEHKIPSELKSYSKTNPIKFEEFNPIIEWWNNREENINAWFVDVKNLNDEYNLDLKNPTKKEKDIKFSSEEIINIIKNNQLKINDLINDIEEIL